MSCFLDTVDSNFYKYYWRFCNARAAWEKGNVERSVDYVRGRAFTSKVDFGTIEEAQEWLNMICSRTNSETGSISSGPFLKSTLAEICVTTYNSRNLLGFNSAHQIVERYLYGISAKRKNSFAIQSSGCSLI